MTDRPGTWTRRQFSQAVALTAASSLLARRASATAGVRSEGFAFIGSSAAEPAGGTVRSYRVSNGIWREMHAISAASPAHLVMHSSMPVLYVVHDVAEWDHRPRGAVSAYRFDASNGHLTHIGTQPLSLSATHPRHAVVVAEADALFVAAESGGIYNVLPIATDGSLLPVSAIRKEFGLEDRDSAKISAPRSLTLCTDGSVYAADPGQETVSRFEVDRDTITLQQRSRVFAGAGASHIAITDAGRLLLTSATDGSIASHSVTARGLSAAMPFQAGEGAALQMHPDGRLLAVSSEDGMYLLGVHSRTGQLVPVQHRRQPRMQQMQFTASGTELVGIDAASGEITTHAIDAAGELGSPQTVAQVQGASSLLLHVA